MCIIKFGCNLICMMCLIGINVEVSILNLVKLNIMGNKIMFGSNELFISIDSVMS